MFDVEIYRTIYDGSNYDDSKMQAATMISIKLPFIPSLDVEIWEAGVLHGKFVDIKWIRDKEKFQCRVADYFGNADTDSYDFEGMIKSDIRNGWKLVLKQSLV